MTVQNKRGRRKKRTADTELMLMAENKEKEINDGLRELKDEELECVTGGLWYWSPSDEGDEVHCPRGGEHNWVGSPTGSFKYCTKCQAEIYI